jgi:hypothetical protein
MVGDWITAAPRLTPGFCFIDEFSFQPGVLFCFRV